MGLEELKERIHNFRIPIRNPRVLVAVKTLYFVTPIVIGYHIMQAVIPDPEKLKAQMKPPSEYAADVTERQKRNLQEALEKADASFAPARAQQSK